MKKKLKVIGKFKADLLAVYKGYILRKKILKHLTVKLILREIKSIQRNF